jgi:hypothetical protein
MILNDCVREDCAERGWFGEGMEVLDFRWWEIETN